MTRLPKHEKYVGAYRPSETFWGFGVEHETYLESAEFKTVAREDLMAYRRPERYSVNYYKSYKDADLVEALRQLPTTVSLVPMLVNSHSFTHCDVWMNHRTTYERVPRMNPQFCGRTVHDDFLAASAWYRSAYDKTVVYDGDTFEFMNLNFYNVGVEEALEELWETEDRFLWEFNQWIMAEKSTIGNLSGTHLSFHGPFCIARRNYPFARHLTNPHHYTMFNNGTIHVNLTLPTALDEHGEIADRTEFRRQHQRAARYFQWFEPLLAVVYGTADPFGKREKFSAASQRLAVSRYVGLCNYPSDQMPEGKILLYNVSGGTSYVSPGVATSHVPFGEPTWYNEFYKRTAYVCLETHGLDINYMKHKNHGLEFRIFDGLRRDQMLDVCRIIWNICYWTLDYSEDLADSRATSWFQELVLGCMLEGADYVIPWSILQQYLEAISHRKLLSEFDEKEPVRVGTLAASVLRSVGGECLSPHK
jgi:hypothetical protein